MCKPLLIDNTAEYALDSSYGPKLFSFISLGSLMHLLNEVYVVNLIVPDRTSNHQLTATVTTLLRYL